MPEYRRLKIPHSCYFFTVATYKRNPIFTSDFARSCLKTAMTSIRDKYPYILDGMVVLPDHLHTLWSLPEGDSNFSLRWNLIKNRFTRLFLSRYREPISLTQSRLQKGEQGIWQRRFWEHWVRNEADFIKHLDYIHYNPVKHGYVRKPVDWEWSTFHRFVSLGWYDLNWGSQKPEILMEGCEGE